MKLIINWNYEPDDADENGPILARVRQDNVRRQDSRRSSNRFDPQNMQ